MGQHGFMSALPGNWLDVPVPDWDNLKIGLRTLTNSKHRADHKCTVNQWL
jgi:hypothetical protein